MSRTDGHSYPVLPFPTSYRLLIGELTSGSRIRTWRFLFTVKLPLDLLPNLAEHLRFGLLEHQVVGARLHECLACFRSNALESDDTTNASSYSSGDTICIHPMSLFASGDKLPAHSRRSH